MDGMDRFAFREVIQNPDYTGGVLAEILQRAGYTYVDRMAVDYFRRKLRAGKAKL
jgi:hypothetical protein